MSPPLYLETYESTNCLNVFHAQSFWTDFNQFVNRRDHAPLDLREHRLHEHGRKFFLIDLLITNRIKVSDASSGLGCRRIQFFRLR